MCTSPGVCQYRDNSCCMAVVVLRRTVTKVQSILHLMLGFLTGVIIFITKNSSKGHYVKLVESKTNQTTKRNKQTLVRIGLKPTVCKIKLPPSQSFVRLWCIKKYPRSLDERPYINVKYCVYISMYCVYMYISVCVCITYKYMLYVYIFLYIA